MDVSPRDTSVPRARQLRDEQQSGRYPTREYQQCQPSLKRGAADQTDPNMIVDEHELVLRTTRQDKYARLTIDSHINVHGLGGGGGVMTSATSCHAPSALRAQTRT
jgi:hypothetical protein